MKAHTHENSAVPEVSSFTPRQPARSLNRFSGRWLNSAFMTSDHENHHKRMVAGSISTTVPTRSIQRCAVRPRLP